MNETHVGEALQCLAHGRPRDGPAVGEEVEAQPLPSEPWLYIGGVLGVCVMAIVSVAVHHLGVLALGLATICGQVVASVVLDLVMPADHPVTAWSLLGAALTIVAVAVSSIRRPRRS